MILKLNGGRGALLCDKCRVIVMEDFASYELKALIALSNTEGKWFCEECDPAVHKVQAEKLVAMVNQLAGLK